MARTWDVFYQNLRTHEWTFLDNFHARTPASAERWARANHPVGARELRIVPGPDKPKPKVLFTISVPLRLPK